MADVGSEVFNTLIPELTDSADIQTAFKLYHFGDTEYAANGVTNSVGIAGHLLNLSTVKANIDSPTFTTPNLGVATATTINGITLSTAASGFVISGGTSSKTLTVPISGTIGTAAFTNSSAYLAADGNALTATKATNLIGGVARSIPYQTATDTTGFVSTDGVSSGFLLQYDTTNGPQWVDYSQSGTITNAINSNYVETLNDEASSTQKYISWTDSHAGYQSPKLTDSLRFIPSAGNLLSTKFNGLSLTPNSVGFAISGGTTSKALSTDKTLAFTGTDGSLITFPAGTPTLARTDSGQQFSGSQIFSVSSATSTPIKISAASAQTANLQEWNDSSGTNLLAIDSNGYLTTNAPFNVGSPIVVKGKPDYNLSFSSYSINAQTRTVITTTSQANLTTGQQVIGYFNYTVSDNFGGFYNQTINVFYTVYSVSPTQLVLNPVYSYPYNTPDNMLQYYGLNINSFDGGYVSYTNDAALQQWKNGSSTIVAAIAKDGSLTTSGSGIYGSTVTAQEFRTTGNAYHTNPNVPAFKATMSANQGPSTTTTLKVMPFNTIQENNGGYYNSSTYKFTAPVAGMYLITLTCAQSTATNPRIGLYKNGIDLGASYSGLFYGNAAISATLSIVIYLAKNDYIQPYWSQNNTTATTIYGTYSSFSGILVG